MAKTILDFEKPIYELESKLDEMKKFSDNLDIEKDVVRLEEKVMQLKKEKKWRPILKRLY